MTGNLTPREAAFLMIARHEAKGSSEYHFPNEHGGETIVGVVTE